MYQRDSFLHIHILYISSYICHYAYEWINCSIDNVKTGSLNIDTPFYVFWSQKEKYPICIALLRSRKGYSNSDRVTFWG